MRSSVLSRLKKYSAMAVAGAAATTAMQCDFADADIVYSGAQNISVPFTFTGIYIDIDNGIASTTDNAGGGADFNLWDAGGANWRMFWATGQGVHTDAGFTLVDNLSFGVIIDGSSFLSNAQTDLTGTGGPWDPGSGYMGLQTGDGNFGWIQLTGIDDTFQNAVVVDWAFEDSGAAIAAGDTGAGAIPEPGSLALVGLGAVAFAARRRRS